jgi:oxygen-independent coproporphyrinogen-3 oxidase
MITNILRVLMARSIMPFIFSGAHNSELNIDVENIGLYFHIPFCRVLCRSAHIIK